MKKRGFFLARTVNLLAKEKCRKWHEPPSMLGRTQGAGCLEMGRRIPTSHFQSQLCWAPHSSSGRRSGRSRILTSNTFQL